MKQLLLTIFSFAIIFQSVDCYSQNQKADTILIRSNKTTYNGYSLQLRLITKEEDTIKQICLYKQNLFITVISEENSNANNKLLGFVVADFGNEFIWGKNEGSGNPCEISVFNKENGKILKKGILVDIKEVDKVLLYLDNEKLFLYDFTNHNQIAINDFNEIECIKKSIYGIRGCVEIDTINKNDIVLKGYDTKVKMVTYKR